MKKDIVISILLTFHVLLAIAMSLGIVALCIIDIRVVVMLGIYCIGGILLKALDSACSMLDEKEEDQNDG